LLVPESQPTNPGAEVPLPAAQGMTIDSIDVLVPKFFLEFRENPTSQYAGSLSFEFLPLEKSQSRDLKMSSTTLHGPEHP